MGPPQSAANFSESLVAGARDRGETGGRYCVSGSDFKDCARRACRARMTASSTSTRFLSSSVRTVLLRGGGMSWTAGKAGAICGRLGASCDMPPAETGNCAILEHETREPARRTSAQTLAKNG